MSDQKASFWDIIIVGTIVLGSCAAASIAGFGLFLKLSPRSAVAEFLIPPPPPAPAVQASPQPQKPDDPKVVRFKEVQAHLAEPLKAFDAATSGWDGSAEEYVLLQAANKSFLKRVAELYPEGTCFNHVDYREILSYVILVINDVSDGEPEDKLALRLNLSRYLIEKFTSTPVCSEIKQPAVTPSPSPSPVAPTPQVSPNLNQEVKPESPIPQSQPAESPPIPPGEVDTDQEDPQNPEKTEVEGESSPNTSGN